MIIGKADIAEGADIVATKDTLQTAITELVEFPYQPDTAAWVTKVSSAPTEVIAGAIVMWVAPGGTSRVNGDPMAPRREAAMAILQARFAAEQARSAIEASRQTRQLIYLTWGLVLLAVALLVVAAMPLFTPTPTHAMLMSVPRPK